MSQENLFKEYKNIFQEESEEKSDAKKKERFFAYSPFALQDAIGEKNIKKIWIEYEKLRFQGIEADELIYKIISKIKEMTAIILGVDAESLGIKDYPYNKSKKDLKNWKLENLKNLYTKLVFAFHESRMGKNELDVALEKIILSI
jgi:hypothetical protein